MSLWSKTCLIISLSIILVFLFGHRLLLVSSAQTLVPNDLDHLVYLPYILKSSSSPLEIPLPSPFPSVPTMTLRITNTIAFIVDEGRHSLWIANIDGSGEKKILDEVSGNLPSNNEWTNRVVWSRDGQWLAVNRFGGLWILSPDGESLTEIVPVDWGKGKDIINFAWSPDGTKIAFLQRTENNANFLGIVELATGKINYLVENPRLEYSLSWSPDNQRIALADHDTLSMINVNSGAISSLGYACQGANIVMFSWSPQSDRLAVLDVGNGRYSHGESCIIMLDGQKINLNVGGSSGEPFWTSDGDKLYVSATNFNPDDPNLEKDPRLLLFDKTGQLIKRLAVMAEVGDLPEISPDRQQFLSWIPDEQNWFEGYIQVASLEAQVSPKRVRVPTMVGRLVNADDLNALYIWAADSRNGMFLSVTDLRYTIDLHYGSVYALDKGTGGLRRITNDHRIKYIATSPVFE